VANHVESLLRQIVMLPSNDLAEALIVSSSFSVLSFQTGKLSSYEERLREEPL